MTSYPRLRRKSILGLITVALLNYGASAEGKKMQSKTLQIYSDYRLPIDLRRVAIMPDVQISYSIGTGLVEFDTRGGITAALAESWKIDSAGQTITFTLRRSLWSDGSPITAQQVVESFDSAKAAISKDVPSVFASYVSLKALGENQVRFQLQPNISAMKFLERLCEPMYGLTRKMNGEVSTTVTSGAYFVTRESETEIELSKNPHWLRSSPDIFEKVVIRRSPAPVNVLTLANDPWPMVINIPNFVLKSDLAQLPAVPTAWRRHMDILFSLRYAGRSSVQDFRKLIQFLKTNGSFSKITELVDHALPAEQVYPKGISLYSSDVSKIEPVSSDELRKIWKHKEIKILFAPSRFPREMVQAINKELCKASPVPCEFVETTIQDMGKNRRAGVADLVLAGVGVDSINLDGGLSYYFETEPNMIPSDDSPKGNFKKRLQEIRVSNVADPVPAYRQLMKDVIETSSILPLFHASTTFMGKSSVDLSKAPLNYEVVPFQEIRKSN